MGINPLRIFTTNILLPNLSIVYPPDKAPNTAPPAKVDTIAPRIGESPVVSKYFKKWCEAITSVMTPESYPNRKLWYENVAHQHASPHTHTYL